MRTNGNGNRTRRLNGAFRRWRAVHLVTGLIVALWLLLMAITGVLINHQEDWGLLEMEVNNRFLPSHYTNEYHPDSNGLALVIADLHSGRFFGEHGKYIGDVVALLILISISSGIYSYLLRRRLTARRAVEARQLAVLAAKPPASDVTQRDPQILEPGRRVQTFERAEAR